MAGVSHSTVSRALNDSPLVNEKTRERIKALAADTGYIPNAVARSLKARHSGTVGLILTSLTDPFFAEVMHGVDTVAGGADLSMFVTASHNDPEREMAVIETFHQRRVEGIIVAASRLSDRYAERLRQIRVPIVLINQHAEQAQTAFHTIAFNERAGARLATEHLIELGHRRIGYLGLGNRQRSNDLRLRGYRDALQEAGLSTMAEWELVVSESEIDGRGDIDVGKSALPQLSEAGVTAMLCYNDRVAVGGLQACQRAAVAIPDELSVVGFDDLELAQWVSPPLTTVRQPKEEMGRLAMEMLLDLLAERTVADRLLSPVLIRRASTAPVRRKEPL